MTPEQERIHVAGRLLNAEAHVTKALDELAAVLEVRRGDEFVMYERTRLEDAARMLSWRAEQLRTQTEAA